MPQDTTRRQKHVTVLQDVACSMKPEAPIESYSYWEGRVKFKYVDH